jgi:hypothetical protein
MTTKTPTLLTAGLLLTLFAATLPARGDIAAGTITGDRIAANTITADKMSVSSLSAITADLGTVNAGAINGLSITGGTITGTTISGVTVSGSSSISGASISGGSININSGAFQVGTDGNMSAASGSVNYMATNNELRLYQLGGSSNRYLCLDSAEVVYASGSACTAPPEPLAAAARLAELEWERAALRRELRVVVEQLAAQAR